MIQMQRMREDQGGYEAEGMSRRMRKRMRRVSTLEHPLWRTLGIRSIDIPMVGRRL